MWWRKFNKKARDFVITKTFAVISLPIEFSRSVDGISLKWKLDQSVYYISLNLGLISAILTSINYTMILEVR